MAGSEQRPRIGTWLLHLGENVSRRINRIRLGRSDIDKELIITALHDKIGLIENFFPEGAHIPEFFGRVSVNIPVDEESRLALGVRVHPEGTETTGIGGGLAYLRLPHEAFVYVYTDARVSSGFSDEKYPEIATQKSPAQPEQEHPLTYFERRKLREYTPQQLQAINSVLATAVGAVQNARQG